MNAFTLDRKHGSDTIVNGFFPSFLPPLFYINGCVVRLQKSNSRILKPYLHGLFEKSRVCSKAARNSALLSLL